MKIYQLHKYGGEWEDAYDEIIGTYLYQIRAEEEKIKAEANVVETLAQVKKCWTCPLLDYGSTISIDDIMAKHSDYCDKACLFYDEVFGMDCENYTMPVDDAHFRIDEVEVIE